jgi:hypothetical protein
VSTPTSAPRELYAANGVEIVYFRFDEQLTEERVRRELTKHIRYFIGPC